MLNKLENLPNFSKYSSESVKESIDYKVWARPTINWKLSCDQKHDKADVIKAAKSEKDSQNNLHETAIIVMISIAYGGGIIISSLLLMLMIYGHSDFVDEARSSTSACCLTWQLILFVVTFFLIRGQRSGLADRYQSISDLQFVNGCGDEFMHIPEHFIDTVREASSKTALAVTLAGV